LSEPSHAIKVDTLIDPIQLKKNLAFTTADLGTAMMQQASLYSHYGVLAAKAAFQTDKLELSLEIAESKVDRQLRDQTLTAAKAELALAHAAGDAKAKLEKALTEAQLAKLIAAHPTVIALKKALNEARQIEAGAKTSLEAFRQKRDMLVQMGAQGREEMKGDLSIRIRGDHEALRDAARKDSARRIIEGSKTSSQE